MHNFMLTNHNHYYYKDILVVMVAYLLTSLSKFDKKYLVDKGKIKNNVK